MNLPNILPFRGESPILQSGAWVAPGATVIGDVHIGQESAIWFGCVIRGDVHRIEIGDRSNIQDLSMVHVTHYKKETKAMATLPL